MYCNGNDKSTNRKKGRETGQSERSPIQNKLFGAFCRYNDDLNEKSAGKGRFLILTDQDQTLLPFC